MRSQNGAETARRLRSIYPQDGWGTPRGLFVELHQEFGFTLDVCATPDLAKCERFFTPEVNGLTQDWTDERCWMNPPYSNIEPWTKKAAHESALVVGLLPVRTDLGWFHRDVLAAGAEVRFIRGRIRFEGTPTGKGHNAPFPSMIVVWGSPDLREPEDMRAEIERLRQELETCSQMHAVETQNHARTEAEGEQPKFLVLPLYGQEDE